MFIGTHCSRYTVKERNQPWCEDLGVLTKLLPLEKKFTNFENINIKKYSYLFEFELQCRLYCSKKVGIPDTCSRTYSANFDN